MLSSPIFINFNIHPPSSRSIQSFRSNNASFTIPCSSLRFQQEIPTEHQELQSRTDSSSSSSSIRGDDERIQKIHERGFRNTKGGQKDNGISGIHVPRQRHIQVSKSDLLDSILNMFESQNDIDDFLRLCSCLDSILHAEHKGILEEMRIDYSLTHFTKSTNASSSTNRCLDETEEKIETNGKHSDSARDDSIGLGSIERNGPDEWVEFEPDKTIPFNYRLDLGSLLGLSSVKNGTRNSTGDSRVAIAIRFQRAFMKLLRHAQFEELSARDLMLTSALNTDYLLTLPINVDWKRASESNAIIFRRGYATERQKGLLIAEKLDYLQSKLLQWTFYNLSKPLGKVGMRINEALKSASQTQELQAWMKRVKFWFKEPPFSQRSYSYDERKFDNQLGVDQLSESDLPIWLAAQRAVPRYEGLLSSVGPRERLLRKLLMLIGLIPSIPETSFDLDSNGTTTEPYLRNVFLSRISLSDIWRPATREPCGNDFWKMLKAAVSVLSSKSILQEPAFQELILLYTEEMSDRESASSEDKAEVPSLQLKIYERIPIPDLPVIFPHKKLSFRILDMVRLDVATILGLLAFFVNYKFEDILLSPSAVLLDVIAISALIIFVTRVALGYKQTWDRYQLLVNRTLYEKTLASGFGSVHFLLDASEQQQFKEAILAYAILLRAAKDQITCWKSVGDTCERFMYDNFKEKVEMPVDKAMDTLLRLGLVTDISSDGNIRLQAIPCSKAYEALKQRWDSLLG